MPVDLAAAERFVYANARLLDRHRLAVLGHAAPVGPVLETLRVYRNDDGGFGHALEPDVRAPDSEPAATVQALEVLAEIGELDDPMVAAAAHWIGAIANDDGGVPFVLPSAAPYPRAPWMEPNPEGSHLTLMLAALLHEAGSPDPWLDRATEWCWDRLEGGSELTGYWVKFSLDFLDHVPDGSRAEAAVEGLRGRLAADGSVAVPGGVENERITPLVLSPRPGRRSRVLFADDLIETELDELERGQQEDGGWTFEWLHWSPGQSAEWRGMVTLQALTTLAAHGRLQLPRTR